jgi:hypothetical protein
VKIRGEGERRPAEQCGVPVELQSDSARLAAHNLEWTNRQELKLEPDHPTGHNVAKFVREESEACAEKDDPNQADLRPDVQGIPFGHEACLPVAAANKQHAAQSADR